MRCTYRQSCWLSNVLCVTLCRNYSGIRVEGKLPQGAVFPTAISKVLPQSRKPRRKSTKTSACCVPALSGQQNGGGGGRDRIRRGVGRRVRRSGRRRPREEEEALLQGAPVHDVRFRGRPEPVHGVRRHPGGPGDRVHHGDDPQSHVHRAPGPCAGGGHRFPHPQGPQEVRQSQRPADHERRAEESPQSFRRSELWLITPPLFFSSFFF